MRARAVHRRGPLPRVHDAGVRRVPVGLVAILGSLVAVFLIELALGAVGNDARLFTLGALPDSGEIDGEYWRLLAFGFLHSTPTHLLLNLTLLLLAGPVWERRAGARWLLGIFLAASIVSGVAILIRHQIWPSHGVSVGASGGMFGLLGASLVVVFRLPPQDRFARVRLITVLVAGLSYSLLPGISMTGHVAGLIVGAGLSLLFPLSRGAEVNIDG